MANIITFTFKTDAPWSENELDDLNSELTEAIQGVDEDHVKGSFNVEIADENDAPTVKLTDEQKQEIVSEFLARADFTARLNIGVDGIGFETVLD